MKAEVLGLFVGKVKPFKRKNFQSAIEKEEVFDFVSITKNSFGSDEVANKKYHGGPQRVVHQYPFEHYAYWKEYFPKASDEFIPSSYGENLSTVGMTEANVCIGDIYRLGTALVQVSEPRKPCGTLNLRYGEKSYLKALEKTTHFGWMYRVLEEGQVKKGDSIELVERLHESFTLARTIRGVFDDEVDPEFLKKLESCKDLSRSWREYAGMRLN